MWPTCQKAREKPPRDQISSTKEGLTGRTVEEALEFCFSGIIESD